MGSTQPGAPLDPDELYDALSNDRRRAVLKRLAAEDGGMPVRELADSVATETAGDPADTAESVYISLIQIHLSTLAASEIITYDEAEKVVAPGPAFGQANTCLEAHAGDSDSQMHDHFPALLSGVSFVVLALTLPGFTPTRLMLWLVVAVQLVGLLVTVDTALQAATLERLRRYAG